MWGWGAGGLVKSKVRIRRGLGIDLARCRERSVFLFLSFFPFCASPFWGLKFLFCFVTLVAYSAHVGDVFRDR